MTQQEVKAMHISLMDNGVIALTTNTRNGKTRIVREITRSEIASMVTVMHAMFIKEHPDMEYMPIPVDSEHFIAITMVRKPNAEEPKK